jgi:hypothetical protein
MEAMPGPGVARRAPRDVASKKKASRRVRMIRKVAREPTTTPVQLMPREPPPARGLLLARYPCFLIIGSGAYCLRTDVRVGGGLPHRYPHRSVRRRVVRV